MYKKIGELCPESDTEHYSFWIPAYQRGYRWTPTEVNDLLRDIDGSLKTKSQNYCMQPLIVKSGDQRNTKWEVIDGQQRLTTIYLILCVLLNGGQNIKRLFDIETERKAIYRPLPGNDQTYSCYQNGIPEGTDIDIFRALKMIARQQKNEDNELKDSDYCNFFNELFAQECRSDVRDSIDRYYILQALTTICAHYYGKAYFGQPGKPQNAADLVSHLKNNFYFLWYEDNSQYPSEETFARFNSGKISLTNADLIKALLLRRENLLKESEIEDIRDPDKIKKLLDIRRTEIVGEWGNMEQIMRSDDDRFWNFIADRGDMGQNSYFSRLELIFKLEMLADENFHVDQDNGQYNIYRFFEDRNAENIWGKTKKDFNILREWYEDQELYHYIGFLSCLSPSDFRESKFGTHTFGNEKRWIDILAVLLKISAKMKKDAFRKAVKYLIKSIIRGKIHAAGLGYANIKDCLEHLSYDYSERDDSQDEESEEVIVKNNNLIQTLLLLANIQELVTNNDLREMEHKFPFKICKNPAGNAERLTLEHIQPQHPILTAENNALRSGEDLKKAYREIHEQLMAICDKLHAIDENELSEMDDVKIRNLCAEEWQTALSDDPVKHPQRMYNLTLLQHGENASLGNKWFFTKRTDILKIAEKKYIPLSTKHVFVKFYSRDDNGLSEFSLRLWEEKDAQAYLAALASLLKDFYEN